MPASVPAALQWAPGVTAAAIEPARVQAMDGALWFVGGIQEESVAAVRDALEKDAGLRELWIHSSGGSVEAGMDLGSIVHEHGLAVRVLGLCASSCANYVFPAGSEKTILPGALVLWHGSLLQRGLGRNIDWAAVEAKHGRPMGWLERWRWRRHLRERLRVGLERQEGFYEQLGVDGRITILGQEQRCHCNWTVSLEDMAAFGIRNVIASQNYAMPGYAELTAVPWRRITRDDQP